MNNPKAIILFGSAARNMLDDNSDIDICIISDYNISYDCLIRIINNSNFQFPKNNLEIVKYTEAQFEKMLLKGSLFIHHLKNEGVVLFGQNYIGNQYQKLKYFKSHLEELNYYREIFDQLIESRERGSKNLMFDGSLIFTIARNICILLSNYHSEHNYGRRNAFEFCNENLINFPLSDFIYSQLENLKLTYERGAMTLCEVHSINLDKILIEIEKLMEYAKILFESESEIFDLESKLKKIKGLSVFGYKERMNIEKTLFSILYKIAGKKVTGFNSQELENLKNQYSDDFNRTMVIRKLFELRNFLKEISSGSAYVRDMALENSDTNRIEVFKFLEIQIKGIKKEIKRLSLTLDDEVISPSS